MPRHLLIRALAIFAGGLLLLALGMAGWWYTRSGDGSLASMSQSVDIGGPFELVDQHGELRTDADFRGRYNLVYFGYTFCPDVCPTSLQVISLALDELAETDPAKAARILPLFITVDPARDDVTAMAAYAEHFHPSLVALTGTPEQVANAAREYRVFYQKVEDDSATDYLMDHSAFTFLMAPDGSYLTHFSHAASVEEVLAALDQRVTD